jgi:uncharacterized tellurite resistance protein B-like protein
MNDEFKKFLQLRNVNQSQDRKTFKDRNLQAELEFALTIILVELASSDEGFAHEEYNTITLGLRTIFGTERDKVQAYINRSILTLNNLRGTTEYADLLRNNLDKEQLLKIINIIEDVIGADGVEDSYEIYLRSKYRRLFGIDIAPSHE